LVRDRAHLPRRDAARGDGEPDAGPGLRHQRPAPHHPHLRFRRRPCGARGRSGGADLSGEPADGLPDHHRGVRRGRHRRDGVDHGRDRFRVRPRRHRGADKSLLSRGLEYGHLRDHGDRSASPAGRALRTGTMKNGTVRLGTWTGAALLVVAVVLPFVVYPVFVMKALCFALCACAFNLLIGYVGLLSFGHAAYFGIGSYVTAYTVKAWALPPELGILLGTAVAAILGVVFGWLAIRRSGIYFAMVTLALAQMVYFYALQSPWTGGEDGIQAVPRGYLFGVLDLNEPLIMYFFVLGVFLLGFFIIHRTIHSPFGN